MNIVFVYFGKSIPTYLVKNLNLHAAQFQEHQVWLITNSDIKVKENTDKRVNLYYLDKYQDADAKQGIFGDLKDELVSFRDGYWQLTILRILAIFDFQERFQEPLLHVEGDVVLMPTFPFKKFDSINLVAYPLVNRGYGCASTLFSPTLQSISLLRDFFQKEIRVNNSLTDMDLLGLYQEVNPERVCVLPSAPGESDSYNDWVSKEDQELLSKGCQHFGGLFDGMTLGQFLLGEDPRNHFGRRPLYRNQEHHSYTPKSSSFGWDDSGPVIVTQDSKLRIFSLHVHSKDIRVFEPKSGMILIRRRVIEKSNKVRYELIPQLMFLLLPSLIKVRTRRFYKKISNFLHLSKHTAENSKG